jgi:hypothetical protein
LEDGERVITEDKELIEHAVQFYRKLFCKEHRENMGLDENFWAEVKVTPEENELLEKEFYEEEVKRDIDESYVEGGGAGLMVFPFYFIRNFGKSSRRT